MQRDKAFISWYCEKVWNNGMKAALNDTTNWVNTVYVPLVEGSAVANAIRWNTYGTTDVETIKAKFNADVKKVADFANKKADYITANIGVIEEREVETDFEDKFNIFFSDVLEKLVRFFRLENVI